MREKLRALYYPEFAVELPTLKKCILLFDEIHFMDRPSFTFDGRFGLLGASSPLRQYEKSFRENGVPLYVHPAPGGLVQGELLKTVEADLSDQQFLARFQEGLRASPHFRNLHIQPGNYGNGETHDTVFKKVAAIDLQQCRAALDVLNDKTIRPYEYSTPESVLQTLVIDAAFCSVKMNFALGVGARQGFSPLADASPYATLLSAKYTRAVDASSQSGTPIPTTDLSLAIFDELVPPQILGALDIPDVVKYRKESEAPREAFLEQLAALHAKLGQVPAGGDLNQSITKIIDAEIRPAATEFRNKMQAIQERLYGGIAKGTLLWVGGSGLVQLFGDLSWTNLLTLATGAAAYAATHMVDEFIERRAAQRECAISYLLDLEQQQ